MLLDTYTRRAMFPVPTSCLHTGARTFLCVGRVRFNFGKRDETAFESTAKVELCHPQVQVPVGGAREGDVSVVYDSRRSGYEMNVTPESPITQIRKMKRPVTAAR